MALAVIKRNVKYLIKKITSSSFSATEGIAEDAGMP